MLIHSLFPCLIHMLFVHNTSRLYDSSIKAVRFASPSLDNMFSALYNSYGFGIGASFPKSQQQGDTQVTIIAWEDEITILLPFASQVFLYPEGNSSRTASHLQSSSNVFKRSGMCLLTRVLADMIIPPRESIKALLSSSRWMLQKKIGMTVNLFLSNVE